jgi:iron complex outermembrane recepter protein
VFTEYRDNWDTGEQTIHEHSNADLAFSPNFIGRLEATGHLWQQRGTKLDLTWSGKYVGRQFLDNTANPNAQLAAFFFSDIRLNATLPLPRGGFCDFTISVLNLFNERFASNGWTYRYTSAGYDARPDNPYTRLEGGAVYNQTGFFPQALRHWMATATLRF